MPIPRQLRYYSRDTWYHELRGAPIAPASEHSTPLRVQYGDAPHSVCMFDYDKVNAVVGTPQQPFYVWNLVARLAIGGVTSPQPNSGRYVNSWTRFFGYTPTFPTGLSLFLVEAVLAGLGSVFASYNGQWLMPIYMAGGSGGSWHVGWRASAHQVQADAYCLNFGAPNEEQYFLVSLPALFTPKGGNHVVVRRDDQWTDLEADHMMGAYYMWMSRPSGSYFDDPAVQAACAGATCSVRVPWDYI